MEQKSEMYSLDWSSLGVPTVQCISERFDGSNFELISLGVYWEWKYTGLQVGCFSFHVGLLVLQRFGLNKKLGHVLHTESQFDVVYNIWVYMAS